MFEYIDGKAYLPVDKTKPLLHWYDKKILVTGIGHSGTNVYTEVIRASKAFNFTEQVEDRVSWCQPHSGAMLAITKNYGSKMACQAPYFHIQEFQANMERFPNLHVLVCLRNPIDAALSGIYRTLPMSMGGDSKERTEEETVVDERRIDDIIQRWHRYHVPTIVWMLERYPMGRVVTGKLEHLILDPVLVSQQIARWLLVEYTKEMASPWGEVRHEGQQERYKGRIDISQVEVYKSWATAYNGFFADKGDLVYRLIDGLGGIAEKFGYEVEQC